MDLTNIIETFLSSLYIHFINCLYFTFNYPPLTSGDFLFCFSFHIYSTELQKRSKELMQNIANDESVLRRSTRVRAPPRENPASAFLKYLNKWKED